jgi:hypothetical protein
MRKLALALVLLCSSCSIFTKPPVANVVIDCGAPAVAKLAQELVPVVQAILQGNSPDWQAMLTSLETVGKDALACALQEIVSKPAAAPNGAASKAAQFIKANGWQFR